MKVYSSKEAGAILGISARAIQKKCIAEGIRKLGRKYLIQKSNLITWGATYEEVDSWLNEQDGSLKPNEVSVPTNEVSEDQDIIIQELTEPQYQKLQNMILDYDRIKQELNETEKRFKSHIDDLRNERDYLRQSLDATREQLEKVFQIVQQRNFIEAKDKGHSDIDQ